MEGVFMRTFCSFVLLVLLAFVFIQPAHAIPASVSRRDIKLPNQVVLEKMSWATPLLANGTLVVNSTVGTLGTSPRVYTPSAAHQQPDYARNVTFTPGGSTGVISVQSGTIAGTNIFGRAITEVVQLGTSTIGVGTKAFKTITSVTIPRASDIGATMTIGYGTKLGLSRCTANAGDFAFGTVAGAYETTRGTMGSHATEVESNWYTPVTAMDGSKAVQLFYIQNFRCFP